MAGGHVDRNVLASKFQNYGDTYDDTKTESAMEVLAQQNDDNWDVQEAHKAAVVLDHPDGSVTTAKIAQKAITAPLIAPGAVGAQQLDQKLLQNYGDIAVQAALSEKATKLELADKADKTYVDTQLADKASLTDLSNTNSTVTSKADKSYVDAQVQSVASGSPKGTYATLSALQTAFPAGNTNIYLVTADGKWYYWNGSAWTAGGVYQSTGLATDAVTLDNVKYLDLEKHHFSSNSTFNITAVKNPSDNNGVITVTGGLWLRNARMKSTSLTALLYFGNADAAANGWTRPTLNTGSATADFGVYTFPVTHNNMLVWNTNTGVIAQRTGNEFSTITKYDVLLAFWHSGELKGGLFFELLNWLKIKKNETDIATLQSNSGGLIAPSYITDDITATQNKAADLQNNDTISFAFVTDSHASPTYFSQIKQHLSSVVEMNGYGNLDFICHGGDVVDGAEANKATVKTYLSELSKILNKADKPVFVLKGNHDDNSYYTPDSTTNPLISNIVSKQEWYSRMIKPFETEFVHDTQNAASAYFYKDFPSKKVRVVCLDAQDYPVMDNGDGTLKWRGRNFWGYGARQVQWLASEALVLPSGWKVLVLSHMPTRASLTVYFSEPKNGALVEGVLQACHVGGTYSGSTPDADWGTAVNANFTGQGARNILAYIHGHNHADYIEKPTGLGWNFISVPNSHNEASPLQANLPAGAVIPSPRAAGADTEDCWDVITINTVTTAINCTRYGAGNDRVAT